MEFILDDEQLPSAWSIAIRSMTEGETIQLDCNLFGLSTEQVLNDGLNPEFNLQTLYECWQEDVGKQEAKEE